MRKLYLFGDFAENFRIVSRSFVLSSGAESARIAVLMQGEKGWQEYFSQYEEIFKYHGAREVFPIFPENDSTELKEDQIKDIAGASGIFMCGGNTFRYIKIYTNEKCSQIIKEKYYSEIPYGGLSAGAILATRFGFLKNCSVKPHFTEKKRFGELIRKMNSSNSSFGFGIDGSICLEITNEKEFEVKGKGNFFLFKQYNKRHFEFDIYKPDMKFILNLSKNIKS